MPISNIDEKTGMSFAVNQWGFASGGGRLKQWGFFASALSGISGINRVVVWWCGGGVVWWGAQLLVSQQKNKTHLVEGRLKQWAGLLRKWWGAASRP